MGDDCHGWGIVILEDYLIDVEEDSAANWDCRGFHCVGGRLVEEYLPPERSSGTAREDCLDLMAAEILN